MQTDFTSVHLGAVQYMGMPNQYVESVPPWLLEGSYSLSMGTLMEVDAQGNIRVTRLNFLEDEVIKQPWVIPGSAGGRFSPAVLHQRARTNRRRA